MFSATVSAYTDHILSTRSCFCLLCTIFCLLCTEYCAKLILRDTCAKVRYTCVFMCVLKRTQYTEHSKSCTASRRTSFSTNHCSQRLIGFYKQVNRLKKQNRLIWMISVKMLKITFWSSCFKAPNISVYCGARRFS